MPAGNSPLYKGCPRLTVTRVTRARAATDAPPTPNPPTVALGMLKAGGLRARMKGETDATAGGLPELESLPPRGPRHRE
jgi:hypothetical protein